MHPKRAARLEEEEERQEEDDDESTERGRASDGVWCEPPAAARDAGPCGTKQRSGGPGRDRTLS